MPENEKDPKELMRQRDELLAKLKKLEDKKDSTKEKIFLKVKQDYEMRLEELNSHLKEQEGVVKERISELKQEASTLKEERESYADKAEELKLRFELGEFEEDEYRKILAEEESRIRAVDEKLGSVSQELDSMKGFVGGGEAAEEPAEEVAEPLLEETTEEEAPPEPEEEPKTEQSDDFVQEKEFEAAFSEQGTGSDEAQKAEIAESLEESIDDLLSETPDDTPAEAPERTEVPAEPETQEAETAEQEEPEEVEESTADESEEPQIEEAFDTGIISEGDAIKEETSKLEGFAEGEDSNEAEGIAGDDEEGLQCPKCNFVNSKDSWYCEKCGAELLQ
jgi:hypothetical protein